MIAKLLNLKKKRPIQKMYSGSWNSSREVQVVSDLDKLIVEPVAFRWNGQIHYIKPIDVLEYLKVTESLAHLDSLKSKKDVSMNELLDGYAETISSVCDTVGRRELEEMTLAQVGALFQIVLDSVTGKAHAKEDQKKNEKILENKAIQK